MMQQGSRLQIGIKYRHTQYFKNFAYGGFAAAYISRKAYLEHGIGGLVDWWIIRFAHELASLGWWIIRFAHELASLGWWIGGLVDL
jgi:hypothetical protein